MAGQAMQEELIYIMSSGMLSTEVKDNVLDTVRLKDFLRKSHAVSVTCGTLASCSNPV